jgi:hypothetical protein
LSLADEVSDDLELEVLIVPYSQEESEVSYRLPSDSEEFKQIIEVLNQYPYHCSFRQNIKSLLNCGSSVNGNYDAGYSLHILLVENGVFSQSISFWGSNEILMNDCAYYIGGSSDTEELTMMNEIYNIITVI